MEPWRKRLWGFGTVGQLVLLLPLAVLAPLGYWKTPNQHQGSARIAGAAAVLGIGIYLVTEIAALVRVYRSKSMARESRRRWLWGLFILNALILPVFWWRLIRPLDRQG